MDELPKERLKELIYMETQAFAVQNQQQRQAWTERPASSSTGLDFVFASRQSWSPRWVTSSEWIVDFTATLCQLSSGCVVYLNHLSLSLSLVNLSLLFKDLALGVTLLSRLRSVYFFWQVCCKVLLFIDYQSLGRRELKVFCTFTKELQFYFRTTLKIKIIFKF